MARKFMTKEVTKTIVKVAVMEVNDEGLPVARPLEDVVLMGNVNMEKAQKAVAKLFETPVTVFGVEANTEKYKMEVEEFIKHATLVVEGEEEEEDDEE